MEDMAREHNDTDTYLYCIGAAAFAECVRIS